MRQRKRSRAYSDRMDRNRLWKTLFAFDRDRRHPGHAELPGCGWRHIDDPAAYEWPAVVDGDDHRAAIAVIGDAHTRPEGQRGVSRGQFVGVELFAARGLRPLAVGAGDPGRCARLLLRMFMDRGRNSLLFQARPISLTGERCPDVKFRSGLST